MEPKRAQRAGLLEAIEHAGGLRLGVADQVQQQTGVPAADVYGVGTFYTLLHDPNSVRVCTGLSCRLAGALDHLAALHARGVAACAASCLGRCDQSPATWNPAQPAALRATGLTPSHPELVIDLAGTDHARYEALAAARQHGADWVCRELEASGLQGRGGAGFPAFIKWNAVRNQAVRQRSVVLNADEGEPGTFKDREVMLRRPHLVIEGLAIAATTVGARDVYLYIRGEFAQAQTALEHALATATQRGELDESIAWHFVAGHGAYICGEETALLEAIEGRRGMPRLKPPFPVESGLFGRPTLIQNVETIACLPAILRRGGTWFRSLGRGEAGTKLYCISGHVHRPGVFEAPLGTCLDELLEQAGGCNGELLAFSPGGASSGFLPASFRTLPLAFKSLQQVGSMLGSAGIVVLNTSTDLVEVALAQAEFFEQESCGQCAPCRIGTQMIRQALERYRAGDRAALDHLDEVAWGMGEASICGLGQAAAWPLTSLKRHFPQRLTRQTQE